MPSVAATSAFPERAVIGHAWSLLAFGLLLVLATSASAAVRFVDDDSSAEGDGLTWGTAYRFLQDALAEAQLDPTIDEIHVAQGVYRADEDEGGNVQPGNRSERFHLQDDVAIRGGYRGLDKKGSPDDRDIDVFVTILSGDLNGDDLPGFVNYADNSRHVTNGSFNGPTAVLEGFTVTAGFADDAGNGAGMLNDFSAGAPGGTDPTVSQCTFTLNLADGSGGAMSNEFSSPSVSDCVFIENRAISGGGAVFNLVGSPAFTTCVFIENTTEGDGGALQSAFAGGTATDCVFESNLADGRGGAVDNGDSQTVYDGCLFTSNSGNVGGAVANDVYALSQFIDCDFVENMAISGGAVYNDFVAESTFTHCAFSGNVAKVFGGGMFNDSAIPILDTCSFSGNGASSGGAIYASGFDLDLASCTFAENDGSAGAALFVDGLTLTIDGGLFQDNDAGFEGGGILSVNCSGTISGVQFISNTSGDGDGAAILMTGSAFDVTDCTFVGNSAAVSGGAIAVIGYGSIDARRCVFQANDSSFGGAIAHEAFDKGDGSFVTECSFLNNTASLRGGACETTDGEFTATSCFFIGNVSSFGDGGAIFSSASLSVVNGVFSGNSGDTGGAIRVNQGFVTELFDCSFNGNSAFLGGAISSLDASFFDIANCILWGDSAKDQIEIYNEGNSNPTISFCDIMDSGGSGGGWDAGLGIDGGGNIDKDPEYRGPGDLRVLSSSPVIDLGDNASLPEDRADLNENGNTLEPLPLDIARDLRVFFDDVDMGAYEFSSVTGACCFVDETCDEITADECDSFGGIYQGDFTSCGDVDCSIDPPVFFPPEEFETDGDPIIEDTGDFDGENGPDVIIVVPFEAPALGQVQVFMNQGTGFVGGGWGGFVALDAVSVGIEPAGVTVGDFNDDDVLDAAVANSGDDTVTVLFGAGDGTFSSELTLTTAEFAFDVPCSIMSGDFTLNGRDDLVVGNCGSDSYVLLENIGGAAAGGLFMQRQQGGLTGDPIGMEPEDLDNDKDLDMLITEADNAKTNVIMNGELFVGGDVFGPPLPLGVGDGPVDVTSADLDGNGFADIVTANNLDDTISIILNNGDGTFDLSTAPVPVGDAPLSVDAGDFDDDGDPDLAIAAIDDVIGPSCQVLENLGVGGGGGGGGGLGADDVDFSTPASYSMGPGTDPNFCVSEDVNQDGVADIVSVNSDLAGGPDGTVSVRLSRPCAGDMNGDGDTGYDDLLFILASWGPCPDCPADLNGDGVVDFTDLMILLATWGPC